MKKFKGKKVFTESKYPSVYWPEHPVSKSNGAAYIHRIVAYEKYGDKVFGNVVHHKDGNEWNWSPENLELMTDQEHNEHHFSNKVDLTCEECGMKFKRQEFAAKRHEGTYCSQECYKKSREVIDWPPVDVLKEMVDETGYAQVGRELGVSDNAVRKRIRNH